MFWKEIIDDAKVQRSCKRIIFWLILIMSFLMRIYHITSIPTGINQDEAMLAVDAWALSQYGTDRFGMYLPVHFTAWGFGHMSVLLAYVMTPFIKLFGFTTFAVRLPMALISTLGVALMYLLARRLFSERLAFGIMLLTAVNPWHFMQSRWTLDCNIFPHIFLIAFYFLLRGLEKKYCLYLSMVFFGLTFYCYGVAIYTTPVFLLLYASWCLWKKQLTCKEIFLSFFIFLAVALPEILTMATNVFGWGTIETPFFTIPYFPQSVRGGDILFMNFSWEQLRSNALALWNQVFLQRPDWLHNAIPKFGPMYPISLPFILVGMVSFAFRPFRKDNKGKECDEIAWLLVLFMSVWSGLITRQVNINRINIIFYPLILFCGYGVHTVLEWIRRLCMRHGGVLCRDAAVESGKVVKLDLTLGMVVFVLYAGWAASFFRCYFTEFPQAIRRQFNADFVELVAEADRLAEYDVLYITEHMDWNYGAQMAEILTQYSCRIEVAYYQGRTDQSGGRKLWPYAERYHYVSSAVMAEAMVQDLMAAEAEYAPIDEQRLYIVFKGELEYLPEGYEVILENGSYLAVAVEK